MADLRSPDHVPVSPYARSHSTRRASSPHKTGPCSDQLPAPRLNSLHHVSSLLLFQVPHLSNMQPVLDLTHKLREAPDANVSMGYIPERAVHILLHLCWVNSFYFKLKSAAASLSTRQLLRIARRLADYPTENLHDVVQKACLAR